MQDILKTISKSYILFEREVCFLFRKLGILLVVVVMVTGISVIGMADNNTLNIGSAAEATGLDPRLETDIPSAERLNIIMEPLVTFNSDMELETRLATSWEFSDDSLRLSFWLRDDVLWHDGTQFTAEDVKYTMEWVLSEDNAAPNRPLYAAISEIVIEDDYTIHFHLSSPNVFLLNNIARMPIVPAHHGDRADFRRNPVGTGPYKFVSWTRDDRMVMVANEDYWGGVPIVKNLVFRAIPEDSGRLLAFEAGEIDMYQGGIVPQELPRLEEDPNIIVQRATGTGHVYLGFQTRTEPFDNLKVRQAMAHLLNREAIIDRIQNGIGTVSTGPVPAGLPWYNPDVRTYDYSLERARELMAEAGLEGADFTVNLHTNENPLRIRISELLQFEAARIGISVNVTIEEWGSFWSRLQQPDHPFDMFIVGWVGQVDPDRAMYRQFHTDGPFNFGGYSDERLDYLLEKGLTVDPTTQESIDIYREAQAIVAENCYYGFINYYEEIMLTHPYMEGPVVHPYTANAWQNAHLFSKNK